MTSAQMPADRVALSVADVLDRAADLITPEGAWIQGSLREEDEEGEATCFCAAGAIYEACGEDLEDSLGDMGRDFLARVLGFDSDDVRGGHNLPPVPEWNDAPGRTQSEVVTKLREAAALAREQGL